MFMLKLIEIGFFDMVMFGDIVLFVSLFELVFSVIFENVEVVFVVLFRYWCVMILEYFDGKIWFISNKCK